MMGVHAMHRHDWHWLLLVAAVVLLDQACGQEVSTNAVAIAEQAPYFQGADARGVRMRCVFQHNQAEGFAYVWRRNGGAALPDDGSRFSLTRSPPVGNFHFFIGLLNLSSADVWSVQDAGTYTCDAVDQRTNTTLATGTLNLVIEATTSPTDSTGSGSANGTEPPTMEGVTPTISPADCLTGVCNAVQTQHQTLVNEYSATQTQYDSNVAFWRQLVESWNQIQSACASPTTATP